MIETNPQYVEPGYFYGSQYFLDRVELTSGKKPSIETRLGDGYFECGLIRKQLQAMAGRTILRDGCDEAEQYRRLYENALAEAEALELRPGVRLSKEQVASLRRDMIWLEEQSLEGTRVLVPRVYLTESTLKGLSMSSANLIAAQIDLKSGELRNRGLIAAESMKLQADGSIVNVAGKLLVNGPAGATGVNKMATFGMGFALTLFTLFVVLNLIDSRSGRAIMAIRDNRIAAEAMGLNVTKYKMMAFVTSAVLAGMAGALYGLNFSTVAASKFKFDTSILVLVFVVLGGIGNIRGSIISATLLTILPELLRAFANYRMLIYAIVLILVMLATNNPTLRGMVERIIPRGKGRKKEADEA